MTRHDEDIDPKQLRALAQEAKAWPFDEARKLARRFPDGAGDGPVLFETGYGASGLPHIGTFGEVVRTSMVRHAFETLTGWSTRLVCFSDDMDALRKVPDNVPHREMLAEHLGRPLTRIPDPFGTHESFGAHNNARLKTFLDRFGFEYEFFSATECYRSGRFDAVLRAILARYDEVMAVVLPILGEERRRSWSPFLPISPKTGRILQVPLVARDVEGGTVTFRDEDGEFFTVPVTGGHVKCQWRVDWAMRWTALGVDYEMAGKDLIDSVRLSSRICRILGGRPPEGFIYELFLDERGEKISKSKGNGISIEDWLRYASAESLSLFMYQSPRRAKRLYFDVIPKAVDDYYRHLAAFRDQDWPARLENPVWHIHGGNVPEVEMPVSFALLLNLVSAAHAPDRRTLWGFVEKYAPGASPERYPELDRLMAHALAYYEDFVKPSKKFRVPTERERVALADLADRLAALAPATPAEEIQNVVYAVGREHGFEPLRDWFRALYEVLLGQSQGPRFGGFVELYGIANTVRLIRRALAGEDLGAEDVSS